MNKQANGLFGEATTDTSVRELFARYLAKWPIFVACLAICIGTGLFYVRYTVPKYLSTTSFLIKGAEGGTPNSADIIEMALSGKREININNEILLIGSPDLMSRTVAKHQFNVVYVKKGTLLNVEIYKDAPFTVTAKNLTDSNRSTIFSVDEIQESGGTISYGEGDKKQNKGFKWQTPFVLNKQTFVLSPTGQIVPGDGDYLVSWLPIQQVTASLLGNLSIKSYDIKTSVIELSIKTENLQKGKDILNALFTEFNQADIEERKRLSVTTVQFIDDRLLNISGELKGVEGNLESYQGSRQIIDIKGQSAQSLENANEVSKSIKDLAIQQGVVRMLRDYFANPANSGKLVPSSLGLNDGTLASLIVQYNELQLKRERETPLVAPNSTVMQDLNGQLASLKSSIQESLNNISKNLQLQQNSSQQQNSQYRNFLASVPQSERVLQEIKRKQGITEGLYLYLLQKREEAAISSTSSSVPHYKQITMATGYGPVEPNARNIILYSSLLGFFVAFGIIYVGNLFNDKVTRKEIEQQLSIPILGEITYVNMKNKHVINVLSRTQLGEQLRSIRTNLSFLNQSQPPKVILVTSSVGSEGKTFVSLNLAAVLATPGKKVALVELDLRKPSMTETLQLPTKSGITDYLQEKTGILSDLFHVVEGVPTLHLYPAGNIPENPGDLLLSARIEQLLFELKSTYDYVIIDSAPATLVSDAFVLGKYSDAVLYVIRELFTSKKQLKFIEQIVTDGKVMNVAAIINAAKPSREKNYYA
ncbi:polysaccharide biosynthesis tyrosine autokinase [Segetibacter sp. 3557_3]|uniref:exopolysaccharide transport family protein n=1 Tax=Segetibacter sp. 3557_3 TaxID=2547429 RepID=UPI00105859AE|nr:polysaccharide biosynthesis tyrosine autokinase [Segetibacter sp. 3557_3]TDH24633.1 polysaccharide biosynthesis tyrosine autokinase [Segetibacter sp. 3557_3]